MVNIIALIPARGGSQRVPRKNVRPLGGHPLLAWTIKAAMDSRIFSGVYVSSDDAVILGMALQYGADGILCPTTIAHANDDPDIKWVKHALDYTEEISYAKAHAFAILRPTSPFRTAETIKRAWAQWQETGERYDSLRAVEPCKQHPCKMWEVWVDKTEAPGRPAIGLQVIRPFVEDFGDWRGRPVPAEVDGVPAHSCPYQVLPRVYTQNASLEIAWTKTVTETDTIAGETVQPFFTEGHEGFDLNTELDFLTAEVLIERGMVDGFGQ